jgi:hypothetical protein
MSISQWLFKDLQTAKKYLFFKLHRRYQQVSGNEPHGYYDWRNSYYQVNEATHRQILQSVLDSHNLPEWLNSLDVFESLVDLPFVQRRFFKNFTEDEFRCRVRENRSLFQKIGHGRYRLKHPAVVEYLRVRDALAQKNTDFKFIDSSPVKQI